MRRHCSHARAVWNLALEQWSMWRPDRQPAPGHLERSRHSRPLAPRSCGCEKGLEWFSRGPYATSSVHRRRTALAVRGDQGGERLDGGRDSYYARPHRASDQARRAEVMVPKVGMVRFRLAGTWSQVATATSGRVTFRLGQWHVALTTTPPPKIIAGTGAVVGLDRGVVNTLATSDGETLHIPSLAASVSAVDGWPSNAVWLDRRRVPRADKQPG